MGKEKILIEISSGTISAMAEHLAWKKAGFESEESLMEEVRNMPAEEKLELLFRIFHEEIAKRYLKNKMLFIQNLGGRTYVKPEEIKQHLLDEGYTEENGWKFPSYGIDLHRQYEVFPEKLHALDYIWSKTS